VQYEYHNVSSIIYKFSQIITASKKDVYYTLHAN